jgi:hypothetical protein
VEVFDAAKYREEIRERALGLCCHAPWPSVAARHFGIPVWWVQSLKDCISPFSTLGKKGAVMDNQVRAPRAEDLFSVGARISWGAILGGSFVALAIYFMLTTLGAAVGLTVHDRTDPTTFRISAVAWGILALAVALFVGGLMTSLFTVGENKVEAVFYGVIMWGFLVALLLLLGAVGMRGAFTGTVGAELSSGYNWEAGARAAGVPAQTIDDWRRKADADRGRADSHSEITTRLSWYAFAGTWISMIAAGLGGLVGAGPTFRVVRI